MQIVSLKPLRHAIASPRTLRTASMPARLAAVLNAALRHGKLNIQALLTAIFVLCLSGIANESHAQIGSPVAADFCPASPSLSGGSLAGWNHNQNAGTLTQDGRIRSNWNGLDYWNFGQTGADLEFLAGQGANQTMGAGVNYSDWPFSTFGNLNVNSGTWASQASTLNAAIANNTYVQFSFTTNSSYEASRLILMAAANLNNSNNHAFNHALYMSTDANFSTHFQLYQDAVYSNQATFFAANQSPLLQTNTTYYFRVYIYNVTAQHWSGAINFDDFHIYGGFCSSAVANDDTGFGREGTASTVIADVTSNDLANGSTVVLGSGGNATISQSGTWPAGITLNTATGAIDVTSAVTGGSYTLTYELCNLPSVRPPPLTSTEAAVCDTATATINIALPLQVVKRSIVISDPLNNTTNPLAIPGALVRYCLVLSNAPGNPEVNTATVTDDISALPITFVPGTLRINGSVSGTECDFTSGTSGGTFSAGIVTATMTTIAGGETRTVFFDATVD